MPATRRKSQDLPVAEPYTLVGAPKPQLAALTVNALRSHLKHYHLATTGNEAALVDHLHNHLSSLQPGNTNPASAAGSQTTTSVANTNGSVGSQSTTSVTQPANSTTQSTHSGALALPQQLVEQLATYLQQHQTTTARNQGNTVDDDNLSVASGPTHTTMVAPIQMATSTTAVASATLYLVPHLLEPHYRQSHLLCLPCHHLCHQSTSPGLSYWLSQLESEIKSPKVSTLILQVCYLNQCLVHITPCPSNQSHFD